MFVQVWKKCLDESFNEISLMVHRLLNLHLCFLCKRLDGVQPTVTLLTSGSFGINKVAIRDMHFGHCDSSSTVEEGNGADCRTNLGRPVCLHP